MDAPVQASSPSRTPFIAKDPELFEGHLFKQDLTVEIFKWIGESLSNCASVCKGWNSVIPDSIHKRYAMRMGDILPRVGLFFKAEYWPAQSQSKSLSHDAIFYMSRGISPFPPPSSHPVGCPQLLKRDLCSEVGSICNDYIVLGNDRGTYFLQSSSNPDELIITKDLSNPSEGKKISIEGPIFKGMRIEMNETYCLPLSNEKIVFLSLEAKMADEIHITGSIVDLNLKTTITRELLIKDQEIVDELMEGAPAQLGNYFILNNSLIDIENLTMTAHEFQFAEHKMTVWGPSLYVTGNIRGRDGIGSYFINSEGKLEKEWGIEQLESDGDERYMSIRILQVNDQFIALQAKARFQYIHLLNKKGEFLGKVKMDLFDYVATHLIDEILIYKTNQKVHLNFWHIPTKRLINQFLWNGSEIISIQSTNEEVVFLTSDMGFLKPLVFQMIEPFSSLPTVGG